MTRVSGRDRAAPRLSAAGAVGAAERRTPSGSAPAAAAIAAANPAVASTGCTVAGRGGRGSGDERRERRRRPRGRSGTASRRSGGHGRRSRERRGLACFAVRRHCRQRRSPGCLGSSSPSPATGRESGRLPDAEIAAARRAAWSHEAELAADVGGLLGLWDLAADRVRRRFACGSARVGRGDSASASLGSEHRRRARRSRRIRIERGRRIGAPCRRAGGGVQPSGRRTGSEDAELRPSGPRLLLGARRLGWFRGTTGAGARGFEGLMGRGIRAAEDGVEGGAWAGACRARQPSLRECGSRRERRAGPRPRGRAPRLPDYARAPGRRAARVLRPAPPRGVPLRHDRGCAPLRRILAAPAALRRRTAPLAAAARRSQALDRRLASAVSRSRISRRVRGRSGRIGTWVPGAEPSGTRGDSSTWGDLQRFGAGRDGEVSITTRCRDNGLVKRNRSRRPRHATRSFPSARGPSTATSAQVRGCGSATRPRESATRRAGRR